MSHSLRYRLAAAQDDARIIRKKKTSEIARARQQGYRLGLRMAHTIVRKARTVQVNKAKWTKPEDADLKAEYEHCANTLHALCLKIEDEIKKVSR